MDALDDLILHRVQLSKAIFPHVQQKLVQMPALKYCSQDKFCIYLNIQTPYHTWRVETVVTQTQNIFETLV